MSREDELDAEISRRMAAIFGTSEPIPPEELDPREVWWRDHYDHLQSRGYILRPRYSPQWIPSWKASKKDWSTSEDGTRLEYGQVVDATRTSDGKVVYLKRIKRREHPYEVDIALYLSSKELASHPANHCVPVYEIFTLDEDETQILVMPLLRPYDKPIFDTIGEAVECIRQLFEGMQFMHLHRVAHRDCMDRNIMMDPSSLYPNSFHPVAIDMNKDYSGCAKHYTRTQRPPKYYFIDFGLSRRYDLSDPNPREIPVWGGDKSVPEFQNSNEPCDPFATDIYYLGNMVRMAFIVDKRGFEFMRPLVSRMVQADPRERPKIDEVVAQFDEIRRGLGSRTLRSRAVIAREDLFERVIRTTSHWKRRIWFVATRVPAIPTVPS